MLILAVSLAFGGLAGENAVVLPEKYARDPGAAFALVFVTDLAEPSTAMTARRAATVGSATSRSKPTETPCRRRS